MCDREIVERAKIRIIKRLARKGGSQTKSQLRYAFTTISAEVYNIAFSELIEEDKLVLSIEEIDIHQAKRGVPATIVSLASVDCL